ncbi:MAG: imidazole glycerol phosphate synthase subunit HisH [Sedimentisphaerales bacterium]|nr:imidazole glycerol phosphate synthase subunit HisH [Sedimentisphaerales bacterium]
MKIGIIDYGMGNLHSVLKACQQVGSDAKIVSDAAGMAAADKLILPGVGAFADAMETLRRLELIEPIRQAVRSGQPFLGICLGLQLLFDVSYEDGQFPGLELVSGKVVRFDFAGLPDAGDLKIPHMGWNALRVRGGSSLYGGIPDGSYVYFVHSYYVVPDDPAVVATTTVHGIEFASSIQKDNLCATQFHPEKSQRVGLRILQNFIES